MRSSHPIAQRISFAMPFSAVSVIISAKMYFLTESTWPTPNSQECLYTRGQPKITPRSCPTLLSVLREHVVKRNTWFPQEHTTLTLPRVRMMSAASTCQWIPTQVTTTKNASNAPSTLCYWPSTGKSTTNLKKSSRMVQFVYQRRGFSMLEVAGHSYSLWTWSNLRRTLGSIWG